MNIQSQVPPGFRFHPTEEELLSYYLRRKVDNERNDLNVILEIDLNNIEPWDIQQMCRIGTTPENEWYLFSHRDKKYPSGFRTNRATAKGFWKATGRDKPICDQLGFRIGMRKTLVFYIGRAPLGQKTHWIMHEYRLIQHNNSEEIDNAADEGAQEEGWVICRVFKKKTRLLKHGALCNNETKVIPPTLGDDDGSADQLLKNTGMKTPPRENDGTEFQSLKENNNGVEKWATMDRMIASHLNMECESSPSHIDNYDSCVMDHWNEPMAMGNISQLIGLAPSSTFI